MILALGMTWTLGCGDDSSDTSSGVDAGAEAGAPAADEPDTDEGSDEPTSDEGDTDEPATDEPQTDDDTVDDDVTEDDDVTLDDDVTEDDDVTLDDDVTQDDDDTVDDDVTEDDDPGNDQDAGADDGPSQPSDGGLDAATPSDDASTTDSEDASTDDTDDTDVTADDDDTDVVIEAGSDAGEGELIGSAGGVVTNGAGVTLTIAANSIDPASVITLTQVTPSNTDGLVSSAFDFSPDGITFDPAATLTLPFDTGAAAGADVVIAWLDGDAWVPLTDCETDGDAVTCPVTHFTTFGVITVGGDAGTTECPVVTCIETLRESCIPQGDCTMDQTQLTEPTFCWENGVSYDMDVNAGFPVSTTKITWRDPEGAACIVYDTTSTIDGQNVTSVVEWKTPEGQIIATEVVDTEAGTTTITCAGSNETVVYQNGTDCSGPGNEDTEQCTQGTCD
jgi:hypothetical protein